MRNLLILPLLLLSAVVLGQSKNSNQYHLKIDCSDAGYYQISYTGDNWKTKRQIKEFVLFLYYKRLYDKPEDAIPLAKTFKTYQQCEDNNRSEYRKYLAYKLTKVNNYCKTTNIY